MNLKVRDKLADTQRIIDTVAAEFKRPAVMWSAGKDSMVLLYLLRALKFSPPVIFHRDPWFNEKYEFAERVMREWGLVVYDYPPAAVAMQKGNGVLEVVSHYQIGPARFLALPKNLHEPESDKHGVPKGAYLCGLKDLLHRPTASFAYPFDVVFHGHKSSDIDPLMGHVPLHVDIKMNVKAPALAFPLRHWTDDDIWEYTQAYNVPQQTDRYNSDTGQENPDRTTNPDYLPACTRCLDRDGPKTVFCPKLRANIDNISAQVPYVEPARLDYFGKEAHAL